ncbi:hypothetical protein [Sphaerisporangium fuscum]|uniref:hypothetical protein n=1 Tax=Sphaerisporangium fuscum TaxID=2835868 RepID=UPI001BDD5DE4|nr:hypothetical protein [Sphaerisporangium fuscum]
MDPGYIVIVVLGVVVVASALGVALVTIVLSGIRGEHVQWPTRAQPPPVRHGPELTGSGRRVPEPRVPSEPPPGEPVGPAGVAREGSGSGEHPEWTSRDLAGEDMRPVGTHEEKHAMPGRARWW